MRDSRELVREKEQHLNEHAKEFMEKFVEDHVENHNSLLLIQWICWLWISQITGITSTLCENLEKNNVKLNLWRLSFLPVKTQRKEMIY